MKYGIAYGDSAKDLETDVARLMDLGYRPLGGVAVAGVFRTWENSRKGYQENETDYTYVQAMLLDPPPEPTATQ